MQTFNLNILTFPLWWYTTGTGIVWKWSKLQFNYGLSKTGLLLFARHMKEPLYKDYTTTGRIMSFVLRVFLILFKSVAFFLRACFIGLFFATYLLLLPAILIMVVYEFFPI